MDILKNVKLIDLAVLIKDTLIISDTQIGYEESLNKQGVLIPRFQYRDIQKRISDLITDTKPRIVIINGDIKHEFGNISQTEWRYAVKLIDYIKNRAKLILIKGNHDTILEPIAEKKDIEVKDYYLIDDIYICHGHVIPADKDFKKAKIVIIGHEHPAIGLRESGRVEKFKCFLKGKYNDKKLIVQPSFNLLTEGTDVLKEKLLSPFLKQSLDNFEVFVVGDEIMDFGKIKNLNQL